MMIDSFQGEYRFLSNFFLTIIKYEGIEYPSVEHAYQAAKSLDRNVRKRIAECSTPGMAKRMGKGVRLRSDWERKKLSIMEELIWKKFEDNSSLKKMLLETYPSLLIEGNYWHDNFWGDCVCDQCCDRRGLNHLGAILMRVRRTMLNK